MKKEIILVTSYCNTKNKVEILEKLLKKLHSFGKKIFLVTHYPIPEFLNKYLDFYFYDKDNEIIKDPKYMGTAWLNGGNFTVSTKDVVEGSTVYAVLKSIFNGLNICKINGYDIVHHLEYDSEILSTTEIDENTSLINSGYGAIAYRDGDWTIGNYFVIDISKHDIIDVSRESILSKMEKYKICEELLYDLYMKPYNCKEKSHTLIKDGNFKIQLISSGYLRWTVLGLHDIHFHVICFNTTDTTNEYNILCDNNNISFILPPKCYNIQNIGVAPSRVKIFCNNILYKDYNLSNSEEINRINELTKIDIF